MTMKKLVTGIALMAALGGFTAAMAAEEGHDDLASKATHAIAGGHFPILKPHEETWSFAGPFGKYDKGQLQRGLKIYKEVCSACHSMSLVPSVRLRASATRKIRSRLSLRNMKCRTVRMPTVKCSPARPYHPITSRRHIRTRKRLLPPMAALPLRTCRCSPRHAVLNAVSRSSSST